MQRLSDNFWETFGAPRLRELLDAIGVEGVDRRSKGEMITAVRKARLLDLAGALSLPELKAACADLGINAKGPKATLAGRIALANGDKGTRKAPAPETAREAGTLKSALRRLAIDAAGGFRGRDAATKFASAFLSCFGWTDGRPAGAQIPATLRIAEHGQHVIRDVAVLWAERRVLMDVTAHDASLDNAWSELLHVCLQLAPLPQFVILTNQRDVRLYDLAGDRNTPRLALPVDDLPKYSEAFPFLAEGWVPGSTPKIINVGKVSREVADLVARLYRSLKKTYPQRGDDVIKFTLQCIITMFSEDIGLLPQQYFTALLYEGAKKGDVEQRLRELFKQMSTRDLPPPRAVAFFNGGLFSRPVTLALDDSQLSALTKAAEANWTYVDPHIFGSVFQGIMDDAERHATGAHYTAHEDIMRVVGPTIVEPWRRRISAATTLAQLVDLRAELLRFRVLDPACGSGNFLYVAFRELYRLDTELLARMRTFPAKTNAKDGERVAWNLGIPTSNFYGIDTNRFAVELAQVTLNIAKKIAFEERKQTVAAFTEQLGLDVDPSLPLDNLERNIVCADALFTEWPEVEAIVGNPPILGDRKIREALGPTYLERLQATSGVDGVVDISCYWFRRAHDRLPRGGRAGLVGTSGLRLGKARVAALDYLVENGGTIYNAVSSMLWPGDAALNVCMVNWVKGAERGPCHLLFEGQLYELPTISTHLQLHADLSGAKSLAANKVGTAMGTILGTDAFVARASEIPTALRKKVLRPLATGTDVLTGKASSDADYLIWLADCETEEDARSRGGKVFSVLETRLLPHVRSVAEKYPGWIDRWWQPLSPQLAPFARAWSRKRYIVCSNPAARPIFVFVSSAFVATNTMQLFTFDDDYTFGILQSCFHWEWLKGTGGKVTERIRYTNNVWTTFPWPQDTTEVAVSDVAAAARSLRGVRTDLMRANGWSLRALHQAAEVDGSHPLKDAQRALDSAVAAAYGIASDQDVVEFLLELNRCLAEDEEQGRPVSGPGLPRGLDPKDPRWWSTDCIEPPPFPE